jgi:hypothetical protein
VYSWAGRRPQIVQESLDGETRPRRLVDPFHQRWTIVGAFCYRLRDDDLRGEAR